MLMGALCRAGMLIPVHGTLSLDLGAGSVVTEYGREDVVPDGIPESLEGISSAMLQVRLVLAR